MSKHEAQAGQLATYSKDYGKNLKRDLLKLAVVIAGGVPFLQGADHWPEVGEHVP